MKILFVITRADTIGGAQVHVRDLSSALQSSGYSVWVVTGKPGIFTEALANVKINFISCNALQRSINPIDDLRCLLELRNIIKKISPDLVSLHSSKAGILGRLACYSLRHQACLFTAHGWSFTEGIKTLRQAVFKRIEKLSEPLSRKIICVSNYDRALAISSGMKSYNLITIHNGMPDVLPHLYAAPELNNPVQLVMIARMDEQKDHFTLIQAIHHIPNIKLQLVGDGPNRDRVQSLVKELDLENYVDFLGYRSDIPEILSQAQIFLLISNWEGFPRTTLEAMRAGLPVIVSDVGGAAEAVIEGQTGYCVPKGDVTLLRQRILALVENSKLRQQMGKAGRLHYEQHFTFAHMFQKTLAVYQSVLGN